MRIQHNINALNAHRNLGMNNSNVGKNLEKLSSGFRINRAGDDAAGLAISEKMRGQIRGLDMATRNSNDGISLIQTAEGALNETHSILQRMRELAVQSSNGTYEEGVKNSDRDQLQKETQALKDEIDRIASSTHFNNQKLLNGKLDAAKVEGGALVNGGEVVSGTDGAKAADAVKAVYEFDMTGAKLGAGTTIAFGGVTNAAFAGADIVIADNSNSKSALEGLAAAWNTASDAVSDTQVGTGFTMSVSGNNKLVLTAKIAGATLAATDTALATDGLTTANITGTVTGNNIKFKNTVVGKDEGAGSTAVKAKYDVTINFDTLKAGEEIKIGDKSIKFVTDAATANDGKTWLINIAAIKGGNATASTAAKATFRTEFLTALDAAAEASNAGGAGNADYGATAPTLADATSNEASLTFSLEAAVAGASFNIGEFRSTSATPSFTIAQTKGADTGAAEPAKFATASVKMDLTKLKAGDILKFGDREIKLVAAGLGSGTGGVVAKGELEIGTEAAMGTALANKMEEFGFGSGKVSFANSTLTFTDKTANTKAADFARSLPKFTLGTAGADGVVAFPKDGVTFQIGANGTQDDRVNLIVADQSTKTLGIDGIDISTQVNANLAIDLIDKATSSVSATRADLGALQNRLEHTIANLGTTVENLTAAESRIRDVDMAKEMMEMTKNNILSQAAQAMLAQANTQPQGVLQLLQ